MALPHDPADTPALLRHAATLGAAYVEQIATREVAPRPEALTTLAELDRTLPDGPCSATEVLDTLHRVGSPATMATTGPRYFGFVNGGVLPAALGASWLGHAWDQNTAMASMSPAATHFDELALEWVAQLLGMAPTVGGAFVTGATMANVSALLAARNSVLAGAGHDVDSDGLIGAPPVQVFVSADAHSSVFKALSIVGLGRNQVTRLATNPEGAVIADGLPTIEGPAIVCLQAGNVNSGACDPFGPLIDWAHHQGAWVHVDGAFGLWAAAAPQRRHLVAGVHDADSWATDAHKWLNAPYDSGVVLVAKPETLASAFTQQAAYLPPTTGRDPLAYSPESSQRARGVETWAAIASLGRSGVGDLVERGCTLARRAADRFAAAGLPVGNEVVLNQVVLKLGDATPQVLAAVAASGECWLGPTVWHGEPAARFSVSCWSTTEDDIDRSVDAIVEAWNANG
jgi:glutamate/tyrosine decarboxylase-like PLP-dependent enzyme